MRARFVLLFGALSLLQLLSSSACFIVPAEPVPAQTQTQAPAPQSSQLAEGEYSSGPQAMPLERGLEPGFVHCCGDYEYAMQVECGERLIRCYVNQDGSWEQTYGRSCRRALGQGCYERGCISVCD